MPLHRPSSIAAIVATLVALLVVPAVAAAATAPALRSPGPDAAPVTEGGSLEFQWTGTLQGDADALDRSFFRLELVRAADLPSGAQSPWPSTIVENFVQTEPGEATTSATLGVPSAGEYRWRVCAWGVTDDLLANEIQQLPGGCSAARAITSVAATITKQPVGELKVEEKTQVDGEVRRIFVERPADPAPQVPEQPVGDVPAREPAPSIAPEPLAPTRFSEVGRTRRQLDGGSSLGGIGGGDDADALAADQASDRSSGMTSRLLSGLGGNLPLIGIPFWTLLLPLVCIPLLRLWRRELLAMFDWSDGSIDGKGTFDDGLGSLVPVLVAQDVQDRSTAADGVATASSAPTPDAPDGRRHAA